MSAEPDWARVKTVFQSALETPADRRATFVADTCGSDGPLRTEVESLLRAHDAASAVPGVLVDDALASLTAASLHELSAGDPNLAPGSRIDVYEIVGLVGHGSMGQIFKAVDSRLGRAVALKVLSPDLAPDSASRARFEREAKTIASLNHPHICTLFDVGHRGRLDYLVMEYLEGETLTERLRRGPLPVEATRRYATELIEALDAAHRAGIVHRDLKPSNVMITDNGVKVLDFGIATMVATHEGSGASTADSAHSSRPGAVLGTAGYMSPEQARGQAVDKRADIWAFGCLVFEMLSGRPACARETLADTFAVVLEREPDWSLLPSTTPRALIRLIRRCLTRDPSRRLRDIADARADVEDLDPAAGENAVVDRAFRPTRVLPWVVAATAVGLAVTMAVLRTSRDVVPPPTLRLSVVPPEGTTWVSFDVSGAPQFALSPDARQIVLVVADTTGVARLWMRGLDSPNSRMLSGTDHANGPFWSPDGTAIAFFADGKLKKMITQTGVIQELADFPGEVAGGSWGRGGTILFGGPGSGLRRVSAEGGPATAVTTVNASGGELAHGWPQFLPDGQRFLFYIRSRDLAASGTYVSSVDAPGQRLVLASTTRALYSPTGHLLFERAGNLTAQAFDDTSATLAGSTMALPDRVVALWAPAWLPLSAGADAVAYWSGDGRPTFTIDVVDRSGRVIKRVLPPGQYLAVDLSRDASRALVTERAEIPSGVLSTVDIATGARARLTLAPGAAQFGIWAPHGDEVIFSSIEDGVPRLYRKRVPGNSPDVAVVPSLPQPNMFPTDWSTDGRWVLYSAPSRTAWDVFALRMADMTVRPLVQSPQNQVQARLSPDGQWVAYASNESGRYEVYVQSFADGSGKTLVSTHGGSQPKWRRDGRELFYIDGDGTLTAVAVASAPRFEHGLERALFQTGASEVLTPFQPSYAVGGDGMRFLIRTETPAGASRTVSVITNGLAKRAPQ